MVLQGRVAAARQGETHVGGLGQDGGEARRVVRPYSGGVHDARQLNGGRVTGEGAGRRHAAAGSLMNGTRDGGVHERRVAGRGGAGGHGGRALATVAAMAELVIVQAAGELCLLQVGGDMLVRHLLQPCLEQVDFLYVLKGVVSGATPKFHYFLTLSLFLTVHRQTTYLILTPSPASASRRSLTVVLRNTVLVTLHHIARRRVHRLRHGHGHGGRHDTS